MLYVLSCTKVYFIKFNENIKLLEAYKDIEINNELGELLINIEQVSEKSIKVTSFFATKKMMISPEGIGSVKEIFDHIFQLNKSILKVQII